MKTIDELIAEFCPYGVEYRPLGEVCEIMRGERLTKRDLKVDGRYEVVSGGLGTLGRYDKFNREAGTITIAQYGTAGYVAWRSERFWANDVCYSIMPHEGIFPRYLFFSLISNQQTIYSKVRRDAIPAHLPQEALAKLYVLLPPLAIQKEIVRILDSFTELIDELENEFAARRKQYEQYRDKLLTFGDDVERMPLGKIGRVAMCKRIFQHQTSSSGDVPFYKIGTFGKMPDAFIDRKLFNEYKSKFSYPRKGAVLLSAAGTIGKAIVFNGDDAYFQDSNIVWLEHDESIALDKYLFYCYQLSPWKIASGGTVSRLYNANIEKAIIPVPSIPEQRRIVAILDKFDALCNDETAGLAAEIAARKKQYEYYCDKLLTFKKAS